MRLQPPENGTNIFEHQPKLSAKFWQFYGQLWSHGALDEPTKEVARLRNARITDCGI